MKLTPVRFMVIGTEEEIELQSPDDDGIPAFDRENQVIYVSHQGVFLPVLSSIAQTLHINLTDEGNVGAVKTPLMSYTVPGGTMSQVGDRIVFEAVFSHTGVSSKQTTIEVDGNQVYGSTADSDAGNIVVRGVLVRVSGSAFRYYHTAVTGLGIDDNKAAYTEILSSPDDDILIACFGQGNLTDDVVQKMLLVRYER